MKGTLSEWASDEDKAAFRLGRLGADDAAVVRETLIQLLDLGESALGSSGSSL